MILVRHYDEETLIRLLSWEAAERDSHLAVCSVCSDALAAYRAIVEVLRDEATWDLREYWAQPEAETLGVLRAFAARAERDADRAAELLEELRRRPVGEWRKVVSRDRRFHVPAMVQELVAASEAAVDQGPADAVAIGRLAVEVAGRIQPDQYENGVVARAHGAAWRQLAYAAFYVGDYGTAPAAVERARQAFAGCAVAEYELARVAIVAALVMSAQERHEEATSTARDAARVFQTFGDRGRYASAKAAEAYALLTRGSHREASSILEMIDHEYRDDLSTGARAAILMNLAIAYSESDRLPDAFEHYEAAAMAYEEIGNLAEAARVRYNCAHTLATTGRTAEAKTRLLGVRSEFLRLGMTRLAASAGLEIAALLLEENLCSEAEAICWEVLEQLQSIGLSATSESRQALECLREAAVQGHVTPEVVGDVRRCLEWGGEERRLLFAVRPA